jgi:predicted ATPase
MIINTGINDNNSLYAKLLDIRENNAIIKEVKFTTSMINPQFDFQYFDQAVEDIGKLFRGYYPGFKNIV